LAGIRDIGLQQDSGLQQTPCRAFAPADQLFKLLPLNCSSAAMRFVGKG